MTLIRGLALTAAAALLITCGDGATQPPPPPQPGVLTVRLTTPNGDDAALMLRISGPESMTQVVAANGAHLLHVRHEAGAFTAAVFGDAATGGALLRFRVPDLSKAAQYAGTLIEVADQGNAVRPSLSGYALTVE